jgi:UDP-glucuronate 4-epimerase
MNVCLFFFEDIAQGIVRLQARPAQSDPAFDPALPDPAISSAPWRVYNISNNRRVELLTYIEALEAELGRTAKRILLPMQPGDVPATEADVTDLARDAGFRPATEVRDGIRRFVAWYRDYFKE